MLSLVGMANREPGSGARLRTLLTTSIAIGTSILGYAGIERRLWTVRTVRLPLLPPDARPIKILHISDIHMRPDEHAKQRWIAALANLQPDLVINTGDNLAHP